MTLPASYSEEFGTGVPSDDEQAVANQLRQIIASELSADGIVELTVSTSNRQSSEVVLGPALAGMLMQLLRILGSGNAATLVPLNKELTTQQAADILNVSRPYLVKLLEEGAIDHRKVGRHRRVLARDLFEYRQAMKEKQEAALSAVAAEDADLL